MRPHFGKMLCRWRPRFGLRTLFLTVTAGCIWLGSEVERWRSESDALRQMGAGGRYFVKTRRFGTTSTMDLPPDKLPFFSTVTDVASYAFVTPDRQLVAKLPSVKNWTLCEGVRSAEEYRALLSIQRQFPHVDFNCTYSCGMVAFAEDDGSEESLLKREIDRLRVSLGLGRTFLFQDDFPH